jgi:hypothetical protein
VNLEIGYLRIFGCPIYIYVLVEKRMKMEPLGHKGIFVGYKESSKDYRIFIPVKMKIFVRKYVKFEENLASSRSQEPSTVIEDNEKQDLKDEQQLAS